MTVNSILPFHIEHLAVRGRMTRLTTLAKEIIDRHSYPPSVNRFLAELIMLGVTLSNTFKFDGIFSLQVQGDKNSPLMFMVVDVNNEGHVRACATIREEKSGMLENPNLTLYDLFGTGYIAFTVEQGNDENERYQGIVELQGVTLRDCLQHYFKQSEQLETAFFLHVTDDLDGCCLMLQKLPFDAEKDSDNYDQWFTAMSLLSTLKMSEAFSLSSEDVLKRLFLNEGIHISKEKILSFKCRCSREKIESVINTLTLEEKMAIAKEGVIKASCDFCGEKYHFDVL